MAKPEGKNVPRSSTLRWVPLSEIQVDLNAQRQLRPAWVAAHEAEFDPEQIGLIVVNLRKNGKWYVIDGQHRVELLRAVGWGDQQIQCEAFEGLTQAEEAVLFLARNDRLAVRTFDKFKVAMTAGDDVANDIDRIVSSAGLVISDQEKDGHIVAVRALQKVYNGAGIASGKEGPAALARTLKVLKNAWGRQISTFNGTIIEGLGLVQLRYNGKLEQETLVEKLAPFSGGAPGVLGRARALRDMRGKSMSYCVAAVIVDIYNKGRKAGKVDEWGQ